jgi:hypothetical protein
MPIHFQELRVMAQLRWIGNQHLDVELKVGDFFKVSLWPFKISCVYVGMLKVVALVCTATVDFCSTLAPYGETDRQDSSCRIITPVILSTHQVDV